jgi:hypothetical protein
MKNVSVKKILSRLLKTLLLSVAISSCSTGSLKSIDKPICTEISLEKGYCVNIISGDGFFVDEEKLLDGKTWFESRIEMILVPVKTWAELKKYIIVNCKKNKQCQEKLDNWVKSMDNIDKVKSK